MNRINIIKPYRYLDMWVFNDESRGIVQEPFINGADSILDIWAKNLSSTSTVNSFLILFSEKPFPDYQYEISWIREEFEGNWYKFAELNMDGWLCPALFKYFNKTPSEIFIRTALSNRGIVNLTSRQKGRAVK